MKPALTPEQAKAILKRDDLNTIEKAGKGKNLSTAERKRLEAVAREEDIQLPRQITTERKPRPGRTERYYLTEKRRNRVFDLRLADYSIREIADKLKASTQTIVNDLKALDRELSQTIDLTQAQRHANRLLRVYERIVTRCQLEIEKGISGAELSQMMGNMQKAQDAIMKLKQDVGALPKAITASRMEVSGPDSAPLAMGQVVVYLPSNGRETTQPEPS